MKILETELDFNFNDADDMERLEKAMAETQSKLDEIDSKEGKSSELIRETCTAIFDCFNSIFGEGTDKKIFGDKTNLNICVKAMKDLYNARIEQEEALEDEIKNITMKYSPDRAIRKAKK